MTSFTGIIAREKSGHHWAVLKPAEPHSPWNTGSLVKLYFFILLCFKYSLIS